LGSDKVLKDRTMLGANTEDLNIFLVLDHASL